MFPTRRYGSFNRPRIFDLTSHLRQTKRAKRLARAIQAGFKRWEGSVTAVPPGRKLRKTRAPATLDRPNGLGVNMDADVSLPMMQQVVFRLRYRLVLRRLI